MSIDKPVAVPIPTKQANAREIREVMKRGKGTVYISNSILVDGMNQIPHGVYYADGEERLLANGGNWTLIKFHRTGHNPDDGEWIEIATSVGVVAWPT